MDNIKEWTSLLTPELLTGASCRKKTNLGRISAKSSVMCPSTAQSIKELNWTELKCNTDEQAAKPEPYKLCVCAAVVQHVCVHVQMIICYVPYHSSRRTSASKEGKVCHCFVEKVNIGWQKFYIEEWTITSVNQIEIIRLMLCRTGQIIYSV